MALTPLPINNTDRAWLKYTSMGKEHEICFRFPSTTAQATIVSTLATFAGSAKALLPTTDSFTGLRHADSGSNLSFPLAWTPVTGTSANAVELDDVAHFISMTGRSLGGYRCRVTLFVPSIGDIYNFRTTAGANGQAAIFDSAVKAITPALVAVDGANVIWNGYVNIGYNAYWQRQVR